MTQELSLNERVAMLEAKMQIHDSAIFGQDGLQKFKSDMIAQITELKGDIKSLTWKVAFLTGTSVVLGNHLLTWVLSKFPG